MRETSVNIDSDRTLPTLSYQEIGSDRAWLLSSDNVTSPARTPWGGERIAREWKRHVYPEGTRIGESWELSFGPELPSHLEGTSRTLARAIALDPEGWLGSEAMRGGTALLVKLLDAAEALSVQIHPSDAYPKLRPNESGKPESWYVVDASPGACIWMGLSAEASAEKARVSLNRGEDFSQWLDRVPVEIGDVFIVDAGTPHAIGPGVTVVEPQRILPGRRGVTYRYWDWNRRYDAQGVEDANGSPRELHVEEALEVTRWDRPRGDAFLARLRHRCGPPNLRDVLVREPLIGARAPLSSSELEVDRLVGSGELVLAPRALLRSMTVLEGELTIGSLRVPKGRTAVIPAAMPQVTLRADRVHAVLAATPT